MFAIGIFRSYYPDIYDYHYFLSLFQSQHSGRAIGVPFQIWIGISLFIRLALEVYSCSHSTDTCGKAAAPDFSSSLSVKTKDE
jgi:hypothetical protein